MVIAGEAPPEAALGAVELAARLALESEAYDPPLCRISGSPPAGGGLEIRVGLAPERIRPWRACWGVGLAAGEGLVLVDGAPELPSPGSEASGDGRVVVWVTGLEPVGVWRAAAVLAWAWPDALGWEGGRPVRRAGALKGGPLRQPRGPAGRCRVAPLPPLPGEARVRWFRVGQDGWIDALGLEGARPQGGPAEGSPEPGRAAGAGAAGPQPRRRLDLLWSLDGGSQPGRVAQRSVPLEPVPEAGEPPRIWSRSRHPSFLDLFGLPGPQGGRGVLDREAADLTAQLAGGSEPAHLAALAELAARTALDALGVRFPLTEPPFGHVPHLRAVAGGAGAAGWEAPRSAPSSPAGDARHRDPGPDRDGRPGRPLTLWVGPPEEAGSPGAAVRWDGARLALSGSAEAVGRLASVLPYWPATGRGRPGSGPGGGALPAPEAGRLLREVESNLNRLAAGRVPYLALSGTAPWESGSPSQGPEPATWTFDRVLPWEVDRARACLERAVYPRLRGLEAPVIELFLSEPREVRARLREEILRRAAEAGPFARGGAVTVRVRSAWKAGYHWVCEEVVPHLVRIGPGRIERVEIGWAWEPPGGGYLDLPIRWLQELYPADEVIAGGTGIPLERIVLKRLDERGGPRYRVRALDGAGVALGCWEAAFPVTVRNYVGDPTRRCRLIPAGVRLYDGDRLIVESTFPTDLEAIWDAFAGQVLPEVWSRCREGGRRLVRLDVHAEASEAEEAPPVGEETLSALEALHEDLYFGTLDFWEARAREAGLADPSPGSVRPWMKPGEGGPPRLRVEALFSPAPQAGASGGGGDPGLGAGQAAGACGPAGEAQPSPGGAMLEEVRLRAEGSGAGEVEARIRPLPGAVAGRAGGRDRLLETLAGWTRNYLRGCGLSQAEVAVGGGAVLVRFPVGPPAPAEGTYPEAERRPSDLPPLNRVWDSAELHRFLLQAAAAPRGPHLRLTVRTMAVTPEGGIVDGIEVTPETAGRIASRNKQAAWRPTLLLNGRHHANEVASTPAILRFVFEELAAGGTRVNVVAVPLENADGASLHTRMMQAGPRWKLHAARYNRDGVEYYALYFDPATRYPEATVVPRLWGEWLPLVYADLHGIPSHEWVQPFAGYNSPPRFAISFWLPIALIHLIEVRPKDQGRLVNEGFRERLRLRLTRAWSADARVGAATRAIQDRYHRWAAAWGLEEAFPTRRIEQVPLLFHERPLGSPLSFAASYPDVTRAHLVFEVADETATGDYLELCSWADLVGLEALARALEDEAGAPPGADPLLGGWEP